MSGSALCLIWLSLVYPAPTSPREIKSYHLIDLSALDSPQTRRKADSPPAFRSSSPVFFHSESDQDLNELGGPAFILISTLLSLTLMNVFHNVNISCLITELYNVSKRTQENSKSYFEELMQVRLRDKYLKLYFVWSKHLTKY